MICFLERTHLSYLSHRSHLSYFALLFNKKNENPKALVYLLFLSSSNRLVQAWQERICVRVVEVLLNEVCRVRNLNIDNLVTLLNQLILRIYEATIRLDVECVVALTHLLVELVVDLHGILLDQRLTCLEVTLRLDALNLTQLLAEDCTQLVEIIYNEVTLAILYNPLDNIVCLTELVSPLRDELAVY